MQNIGKGTFNYDVLKNAYDSDPKLKKLIKNFNKQMVELKDSEADDVTASEPSSKDSVSDMAKRATDLTDL